MAGRSVRGHRAARAVYAEKALDAVHQVMDHAVEQTAELKTGEAKAASLPPQSISVPYEDLEAMAPDLAEVELF